MNPYDATCIDTAARILKYVVDLQACYEPDTPEYATYEQASHLLEAFFRIVASRASHELRREE